MPETHIGRYVLSDLLASGGMASVYLGRVRGPGGFGRTVAIKQLHPQLARDPDFVAMMLDEARLLSRVAHPNVVATLDVVHTDKDLLLVFDYLAGETLSSLRRLLASRGERMPLEIVRAVGSNLLLGLHAAHEVTDASGRPLGIVHRDVSPQNIMVCTDGTARVLDFGIAKARDSSHHTEEGHVRGKVAYMAPEQVRGEPLDRATDIYAASAVLWEMLTNRRMFEGTEKAAIPTLVTSGAVSPPALVVTEVPDDLDELVMRGLDLDPGRRFSSAREMAALLEGTGRVATAREVSEWIGDVARAPLAARAAKVAELERADRSETSDVRDLASSLAAGASVGEATEVTAAPAAAPARRKARHVPLVALALGALVLGTLGTRAIGASSKASRGTTAAPEASMPAVVPPAAMPASPAPPPIASAPLPPATSASTHVTSRPRQSAPRGSGPRPTTTTSSDGLFDRN